MNDELERIIESISHSFEAVARSVGRIQYGSQVCEFLEKEDFWDKVAALRWEWDRYKALLKQEQGRKA